MTNEQLKWLSEYPDCDTIEMSLDMLQAIEERGIVVQQVKNWAEPPPDLSRLCDISVGPTTINGRHVQVNVNQGKRTLTFKRGTTPLAVVTFCEEVL